MQRRFWLAISSVTSLLVSMTLMTRPAQAIIVTPAIILVPIAKIVAGVMTVASIPIAGLGVWWHQTKNISMWKVLLIVFLVILDLGLLTYIILRCCNSE